MATKRERECAKEPLTQETDGREKRTGQPGKKITRQGQRPSSRQNTYSSLKQSIKSCNAKRRQQGERQKINRSNEQKQNNFAAWSTIFFYISLPLFYTTTT